MPAVLQLAPIARAHGHPRPCRRSPATRPPGSSTVNRCTSPWLTWRSPLMPPANTSTRPRSGGPKLLQLLKRLGDHLRRPSSSSLAMDRHVNTPEAFHNHCGKAPSRCWTAHWNWNPCWRCSAACCRDTIETAGPNQGLLSGKKPNTPKQRCRSYRDIVEQKRNRRQCNEGQTTW